MCKTGSKTKFGTGSMLYEQRRHTTASYHWHCTGFVRNI